ncbi:MAG: hypothetical protein ABIJ57_17270 [Pseudomonadota bacterium]
MESDVIVYDEMNERNVPAIADDNLMRVAEMAEKRIDAVVKIKQMALKVTNARDWTDQGGNPYLQVSGSEKVANLFNISWRLDEPSVETEPDGHFTYTMRGIFSIPGRSISAEGSRSSKDPFFKKYDYVKVEGKPDNRVEKPISAIDRRDVRMAALTNLLGNGITRLLGIRNLSYSDLEAFAGITKAMIATVDYKGKGERKPPLQEPGKKAEVKDPTAPATEPQLKAIHAMLGKLGITDDMDTHEEVSKILGNAETLTSFTLLLKGEASKVIEALMKEGEKE